MKNEFVTFEQAKALKGFGFDEPCFAIFDSDGKLFYPNTYLLEEGKTRNSIEWYLDTTAPTWNQAFRFFRDKGVFVDLISCTDKYGVENGEFQFGVKSNYSTPFNSYEETQSAALDYLINYYDTTKKIE